MEDGRTPELRRMMVEYGEQFWKSGWAPLYGVLGGNPLAAMPSLHFATSVTAAHVLAETGRVAGRARLGLRRARSASRSSTSASTTSSISPPGSRWPRASARGAPAAAPARAAGVARGAGARGAGARMSETRRRAPVRRRARRARADASRRPTDDERPRRCEITGRSVLALGGFLLAVDRRALLPAAAARRPRGHLAPDRGRQPVLDVARARVHASACSAATWRCSAASSLRAGADRIGWRESYQITMAGAGGLADLRRRRRRRPRADGVGAAARRACASALVADKTITFLILTYFPYTAALIVCGFGLRLGIFPGEAPFALTVVPASSRVIADRDRRSSIALVPTDLQRRARGLRARPRAARPARRSGWPTCPPSASAGMRDALAAPALTATPRCSARSCSGRFQIARAVGGVPRVRRRAAARRAHPGVLRRHARQPAADAGRRRRRRGRDDRARSRRSASTPAWPSSPCSSSARSRSGCR